MLLGSKCEIARTRNKQNHYDMKESGLAERIAHKMLPEKATQHVSKV